MTDFSSKFVVYYNVFQYNDPAVNGGKDIDCKLTVSLDYPLVNKASDYTVSVIKGKFDLTSTQIPLGNAPNPLDKILINSATLSVIGSLYSNNLQSQTLIDIDNIQYQQDAQLYFVPPYPVCLTLNNPTPIQLIDIQAIAQFEDGSQQPLKLAPSKSWSCRLAFIRRY